MRNKLAFSLLLTAAGGANAVTVVVAKDFEAARNQLANIAKYTQQITELKRQYTQLETTYKSLNGLRDVAGLMNNDLMRQYLPADYQKAYAALQSGRSGSLAGISGTLNQIAAINQARPCAQTYRDPQAIAACNAQWQALAMSKYVGQAGYDQSAANIANLQVMVDQIKRTPDAKAMQDLAARIELQKIKQAEEATKLQAIAMMQTADENMRRARDTQRTQEALTTPMNFRWGPNAGKN